MAGPFPTKNKRPERAETRAAIELRPCRQTTDLCEHFAPGFGKLPRPACHAVGERYMLVAQLVINGLGAGAVYAFVALGFALIYNATGVLHLAHGAVFALGGYAFYTAVVLLKMPIPVGCLVAVCASAVFGIAIEKLVYRPL